MRRVYADAATSWPSRALTAAWDWTMRLRGIDVVRRPTRWRSVWRGGSLRCFLRGHLGDHCTWCGADACPPNEPIE